MPELPEVETVRKSLEKRLKGKTILNIEVLYPKIFEENDIEEVKQLIKNQVINGLRRRGKWLIFELDDYYLMSHLRMEGKYLYRKNTDPILKHEHVIFTLNDEELRYQDTRKFGKMVLIKKEEYLDWVNKKGLGIEPWDDNYKVDVIYPLVKRHHIPIKTILLDQHIILGIGNIYANEILFLSGVSPFKSGDLITKDELQNILDNTKKVLEDAILSGGTTIHSYTSEEGVTGRFQQNLNVHKKEGELCLICNSKIEKEFVHGRSTYFCPKCQK